MLQYIKSTILGSRIFQRTSSVEVQSKLKQSPKKKPFSFDSKQKEQKDALLTSQRNQRPEVIVQDETATIKKYSFSKNFVQNTNIDQDFAVISDVDEHQNDPEKKKFSIYQHSDLAFEDGGLDPGRFSSKQNNIQIQGSNLKESALMKSSIIPQAQSNGKMLLPRKLSAMKVKRVGQKCGICDKNLNIEDSFQLACSHRCHNECGIQMHWRMRYNCDACEVKKDYSRHSIILSMRRRNKQL